MTTQIVYHATHRAKRKKETEEEDRCLTVAIIRNETTEEVESDTDFKIAQSENTKWRRLINQLEAGRKQIQNY